MPSTYKIILTPFSILAVAIATHGVAMAQDGSISYGSDTGVTASQIFTESDLNKDGGLDREEFVDYAIAQAKADDVDFKALIISGDYDNEFNRYDYNANGIVTVEEMKLPELSHKIDNNQAHEDTKDNDLIEKE